MSANVTRTLMAACFGGAARARREMTSADAAIRGILPTTHRIGVLSLEHGVGASSIAFHLTRTIASRRNAPVLAIDVSAGKSGLAALLGAASVPPDDIRAGARATAQALSGLTIDRQVVALRPGVVDDPIAAWLAEAAPITRFFDVAVTDFGVRHPSGDFAACTAVCDVVCLVSQARRSPAEHARALLPAITALPEAPSVVLALVDLARQGPAVPRAIAAGSGHPVVAVPFDRRLRDGHRASRETTRLQLLRLAAMLVRPGERTS